jgi:hypothetical protein
MTRRLSSVQPAAPIRAAAGLALGLTSVFALFAGTASAQTTTGTTTTSSTGLTVGINPSSLITHTLPNGSDFTRDSTLNPTGINFEDCERDVVLNFPLVASGTASAASGYALYAFAGTNCDQGSTYVSPGVAGSTCWPVVNGPISYNLNASFVIGIRARQILSQATFTVKEPFTTVATTDDSVCHIQPTSAALQISVYFVFGTTMGLASIGGSGVTQINADLAAAAPPTSLTIGIGSTVLLPTWNSITDQDIVGYNVYYQPLGAPAAATTMQVCPGSDGSTSDESGTTTTTTAQSFTLNALGDDGGDDGGDGGDDGSTDAAATPTSAAQGCYNTTPINATPIADAGVPYHPNGVDCPSPYPAGATGSGDAGDLSGVSTADAASDTVDTTSDDGSVGTISTAASVADISMQPREAKLPDGSYKYPFVTATGNTANSATLSNLTNNVEYVVGVAATDSYGNVGALSTFNGSDMICQWPQQVTDFFDSYRSAGGLAGGSFCQVESPDLPTGAGGSALVAGAALVFALRRRRR